MIEGLVNTANDEKMKIKCEGKVNVNHFTTTGYESKGTLSITSPNMLLLYILELHFLCEYLLLEQTEFPSAAPA